MVCKNISKIKITCKCLHAHKSSVSQKNLIFPQTSGFVREPPVETEIYRNILAKTKNKYLGYKNFSVTRNTFKSPPIL